jgi:primosomal protein N' (replication factor Y)
LTRRTPAPLVEVIDLRQELADGWRGMMSRSLLERLTALDWAGGSQALLIINRRGLASALLCRDCGAAQSCPSCERPLVLHSAGSLLRCHGCGSAAEPLTRCPSCGGARIRALGGGTERLEAEVRAALPDVIVDRLDADAASAIGSGDRILLCVGSSGPCHQTDGSPGCLEQRLIQEQTFLPGLPRPTLRK